MFFIDEIPNNKIKKKKYLLPIDLKNKRRGGCTFLLTPDYESTKNVLTHPLFINRYYGSYYVEKSTLYYVNQEGYGNIKLYPNDQYIEESYDRDMLYDKSNIPQKIVYKGFDSDTSEMMRIINFYMIDSLNNNYRTNIEYPLYIEIFRNHNIPNNTKSNINIASKNTFNKSIFKNYNCYCKFNLMISLLLNINENMNMNLVYAVALYESGLYNICRRDWKFNKDLLILCNSIDGYLKNKNHSIFIKEILKNNDLKSIALKLQKYGNNLITSDIMSCNLLAKDIYIKEQYDEYDDKEINVKYNKCLNESSVIKITNDKIFVANEDAAYNGKLRRYLYNERIKTGKEVLNLYKKVKTDLPFITNAFIDINRYKKLNLLVDLSHYNNLFIKNNEFKLIKGYNLYNELMNRLICDKRFSDAGYKKKTVVIPILDWDTIPKNKKLWLINIDINPISCLYKTMMTKPDQLKSIYGNTTFLFLGSKSYFKINFNDFDPNKDINLFLRNVKLLRNVNYIPEDDDINEPESSSTVMAAEVIDKVEKSQNVVIDNIKPLPDIDPQEEKMHTIDMDEKEIEKITNNRNKNELVKSVNRAAELNTNIDDTIDSLEDDDNLKKILSDLATDPDNGPNISAARTSRILKIQNDFLDKDFNGKKISDILDEISMEELPTKELKIDSINEEWKNLKYVNSLDNYKMDNDIIKIFKSFEKTSNPLYVMDIQVEDTSTSEDAIVTYTVKYEDNKGSRFTVVIDIPKFINNRYMKLRGNRKEITSQLFLMPILKTDQDAVQIVSFYNKMFIKRFGTTTGKSNVSSGRLIKALFKEKYKDIKVTEGDNIKICNKYELPIDYIDISRVVSKIDTKNYIFYFNQDELRKLYKVNNKNGLPFGINKSTNEVLYFSGKNVTDDIKSFAYTLVLMIFSDDAEGRFTKNYNSATVATKYTYSKASILNTHIPLIVVCAYSEGLEKTLRKANIKYSISIDRPKYNKDVEDIIKFKDGYLIYSLTYSSSLLMNGLKECDTDNISLSDINKKTTYLNFLDIFGGRIKADGLDNFYDMMIDEITKEVLKHYKLPIDYVTLLLYANELLTDNKYIKHTNISSSRRIRRNEQIPHMLYEVLAKEYGFYNTSLKHGRKKPFSVKRTALIDKVLLNNTTQDQSILNPLSEYESYNTVTPKGPSGMNSERSYSLDKRSYDKSMMNVLSMSTGFAANVGISRQATIDANVEGNRGYVVNNKDQELNPVKTLCMTEALTPFGTTRDDPFRTAMTFIQTSKHGMRCKKADPLLITTGADEALPYLISDTFVFKAKEDGKVIEKKDDEYLVIEYKDGTNDFISLEENVEKNSSSGFFIGLKLDTDLKLNSTIKKNQIVAHDKLSFSGKVGINKDIAYNIGTLCKFAILNTDEGYEDSAIISEDLSDNMTSDVILKIDKTFSKNTNIFNIVSKGQKIEEGDTLLIIQNPTDEEDTNELLRNLSSDEMEITSLGRINIKSKVTGIIQDIVITRTVDLNELSPSLKKLVNKYEKNINEKKALMRKYNIDTTQLGSTEKLAATGKLKGSVDGVLIEFYMKYEDRMAVGDKLIYYSALKGVIKDIFPKGLEPRSDFRPNEKIHSLLSSGSVNGRMVTSIFINSAINKGLVELTRKCKDIAGIKYPDNL